jgi:hypothetical protein
VINGADREKPFEAISRLLSEITRDGSDESVGRWTMETTKREEILNGLDCGAGTKAHISLSNWGIFIVAVLKLGLLFDPLK